MGPFRTSLATASTIGHRWGALGEDSIENVMQLSAEDREGILKAAVEYYADGDLAKSETILVGLIAMAPSDPRPVKLLASTLHQLGRHRKAEAMYERAAELEPEDPYTLVALGEIKLRALAINDAVPIFERLFALDPDGIHPAANRGRRLVKEYYTQFLSEQS